MVVSFRCYFGTTPKEVPSINARPIFINSSQGSLKDECQGIAAVDQPKAVEKAHGIPPSPQGSYAPRQQVGCGNLLGSYPFVGGGFKGKPKGEPF